MSVYTLSTIRRGASRRVRRLLQRLRALRSDAESTYSPAASLALLLVVGIAVKFH
jgi:hypothetical protein